MDGSITEISSVIVAFIVGLFTARKLWFDGSARRKTAKIDKDAAEDKATDRILKLVKDQYELALENERLKFSITLAKSLEEQERKHREEMDRLRTSLTNDMKREVAEVLDTYGCEDAPECALRRPRTR